MNHDFPNSEVADFYASLPADIEAAMLAIRELIYTTASTTDVSGQIEETLKWGVPSYATMKPRSGTPIRLSVSKKHDDVCELSVHCQSTLVADFKEVYPKLQYDRNRSLLINHSQVSSDEVCHFIKMALTYHHRRKTGAGI